MNGEEPEQGSCNDSWAARSPKKIRAHFVPPSTFTDDDSSLQSHLMYRYTDTFLRICQDNSRFSSGTFYGSDRRIQRAHLIFYHPTTHVHLARSPRRCCIVKYSRRGARRTMLLCLGNRTLFTWSSVRSHDSREVYLDADLGGGGRGGRYEEESQLAFFCIRPRNIQSKTTLSMFYQRQRSTLNS